MTKPKLIQLFKIFPDDCLAESSSAIFETILYAQRYKDLTGRHIGEPSIENIEKYLDENSIRELNTRTKAIDHAFNSLCKCLSRYHKKS